MTSPSAPRYADLDAAALSAAYADGSLTPSAVLEDVIARVEAREPVLNAFYLFDAEQVRADAAASTARWAAGTPLSPFDGVPVTVKENVARAGLPKPSGTAIPNPPIAEHNAPITDRLLEAGTVIIGSTTMPDWGMLSSGVSSLHGVTRGGLNPAHTSGGSSAGAGAAASAGYGPFHIGTDIGGSIRLPGTWQGLTALKPSEGLIPLDGPYMGRAAGPLTRTAADSIRLMSIVARPDARDYLTRAYPAMDWSTTPLAPAGMRVAVQLDAGSGIDVEPETRAAIERAAQLFAEAGAEVTPLAPFIGPEVLDGIVDFWRSRSYADYELLSEEERALVLPFIAEWCAAGADFSAAQTVRGRGMMDQMARLTREATEPFDLVLSPVTPVAAFPAEDPMPLTDPRVTMGHISFTVPYNMSGQPAVSVGAGIQADGRTIGLQIASHIGTDDMLLRVAAWFETVRGADATVDWSLLP
ncbi:aspartyl-tRNA(Asn)/glutamyl-tRNA(Gln) amidotransferase subunit A [Leucobacter exalbidus]|uniref:Aspartyl-tRNA(Asn)/glutamyl-tRNA(Gln) amidotransferase subunit A n=1 Tax=Leucobacter exalbidus TaxID=662960 RepID=A0A940PKV5_9MICO|nr:amidase [Leucobacter exalbidus]MBP1325792.1 aspartyl-tRNA(Asn)/glutamyl-tRNA(Gln) amidotransferase subunit A [Leucobacter exalbidus]